MPARLGLSLGGEGEMILVVMGVAGVGKTTIGRKLAGFLGVDFIDADSFHPRKNIRKMEHGIALTDRDRTTWLETIHEKCLQLGARGEDAVVACSALKAAYREVLGRGVEVMWIYLSASRETVRARIERRVGHFAKATLLDSQYEALDEPPDALLVDAERSPEKIVRMIVEELNRKTIPACEALARASTHD